MTDAWTPDRLLQEIWRESVGARNNSEKALTEIGRLDAKIDDVEAELKRNADDAHAAIGSNIAKLGKEVAGIGGIVSTTDGKVDTLHEWMRRQDKRINDLEDRVY